MSTRTDGQKEILVILGFVIFLVFYIVLTSYQARRLEHKISEQEVTIHKLEWENEQLRKICDIKNNKE